MTALSPLFHLLFTFNVKLLFVSFLRKNIHFSNGVFLNQSITYPQNLRGVFHVDNEEEGENENNTNSQPSSQSQVINNDAGPTNSISVPPQSESPSFEAQIPQEVLIRFLIYLNTSPITTFRY